MIGKVYFICLELLVFGQLGVGISESVFYMFRTFVGDFGFWTIGYWL